MASGDGLNPPPDGLPSPPGSSLADVLQAVGKLLDEYFKAHPGVYDNVVGGVAVIVLSFVVTLLWRTANDQIWRMLAWLGGKPGFSKLALSAYRRAVETRYGVLRNIYLGKEETLSLSDVFVPLTLHGTSETVAENQTTQQILADPRHKRLVLLGAPGSGKSTLLKALATGVSRRESVALQAMIPMLVSLRSHAQTKQAKSLLDWLAKDELPSLHLRNPKILLQSLLAQNRVLLMLDGLDEVPKDRQGMTNLAISEFLEKYPDNRVLLTCREQNYGEMPDPSLYRREGFVEYRVADLRNSEIRALVQRRETDFQRCRKSMPRYFEQVFQGDILPLHRNPLLLTLSMGVYLHRPGEEIPHNLAEFYYQAIDNLLRRHDFREIAGIPANRFKAADKFRLLRSFALKNLNEASASGGDFETFSFAAVTDVARDLVRQGAVEFTASEAEEVVKEIRLQAGLLETTQDETLYLFSHRSLNEYCAADALIKQHEPGFQQIAGQADKLLWRQVVFFYCATDDDNAVRLVETLRQRATDNPHRLALAGHCAAVLALPKTQLRLEILQALRSALVTADAASRPLLLKSLLALGNSRDAAIWQTMDAALREFVAKADPGEVAREVGRVEPAIALQFLGYLADSPEMERKQAALRGLEQIEDQDKIPLLWRSLHQLPADLAHEAMAQLLALLGENGAVELLNVCEPIKPPVDATLRKSIAEAYPFLSEKQPVTPFAWLLGYAAVRGFDPREIISATTGSPWWRFLSYVLGNKTESEMRLWRKLPRDRYKWTPRLKTLWLGRLLFGLPLLIGFSLSVVWVFDAVPQSSNNDKIVILLIATFVALVLGWAFLSIWLLWRQGLKTWGMAGELDVYPADCRAWLAPYHPEDRVWHPVLGWRFITLRLGVFFSFNFFLLSLALFLNNQSFTGHTGAINKLTINPQGTQLFSASQDYTARLWDATTGQELRRLQHENDVNAAAFSPDGKIVLTGDSSWPDTARLWDAATGQELRRLQHENWVRTVAFSPDGNTVLTGSSWHDTARLWDAATGQELRELRHEGYVNGAAFAPDGNTVLTGSNDKTARLWDAATGQELRRLRHEYSVNAVAFSPDGNTVLTGSNDKTARLWNAATGQELRRLQHESSVNAAAFAPDGKTVLTGSSDNTARLWDAATGKELRRLRHESSIKAAIFSPNSRIVYTAGYEAIIRAWDVQTGRILWQRSRPFWDTKTWKSWSILYDWLALVFIVYFLPALKVFDRGQVWYPLGKPNRYLSLYDLPGVHRWLPPEDK